MNEKTISIDLVGDLYSYEIDYAVFDLIIATYERKRYNKETM